MALIEPNNANEYNVELSKANLAIVYLTATWCGPCRAIAAPFKNIAESADNASITFLKVDVDKCSELDVCKKVTGVPTFIAFKEGKEVERFTGAKKEAIEKLVATLKA